METIIKTIFKTVSYRNIFASKILQLWCSYVTNIEFKDCSIIPFNSSEIDKEAIQECVDAGFIFESVEPKHGGVVAFVYFAYRIEEGYKKWYAIKIKKIGIETKIKSSINFFNFISPVMPNAVLCLYNELKHSVLTQTDLQLEALELYNWKTVMQNNKNLHIPEVIQQGKNWFAMERIDGLTVYEISKYMDNNYKIECAKQLIHYYISCVINGIYHGDLHAGNILFSKENDNPKIHIFDVGITYHIDKEKSKKIAIIYCRLIELILTGIYDILDYEEIGEIIEHFVDDNQHSSREELGKLCAELLINISKSCASVNSIYNSAVSNTTINNINSITDKINLTDKARQVLISWTMGSGVISLLVDGNEVEISKCIIEEYERLVDFNS